MLFNSISHLPYTFNHFPPNSGIFLPKKNIHPMGEVSSWRRIMFWVCALELPSQVKSNLLLCYRQHFVLVFSRLFPQINGLTPRLTGPVKARSATIAP
jgi:hypothetical protein